MTEEDRISYLNFCVGMLLGTLISIRGQVNSHEAARIDYCLQMVNPLIERVYEYQAKENGTEVSSVE